jgi:hypothetical protein
VGEISAPYGERPEGSTSKLATWRDGFLILTLIGILVQRERPLEFFSAISALLFLLSLLFGVPVITEFLRTGLVPRFPTAVLASALMIASFLSLSVGLILNAVTHSRREMKRLAYLASAQTSARPH